MALHPFEAYPWLDKRGLFAPAWVSLDQNNVQESAGLLGRLRLRAGLRAVCTDGPQRKSSFNEAPHVQLGSNFLSSVASRSKPSVLPLALEKVCQGGSWPPLPETEKPLPYLPRTTSKSSLSLMAPQTFRRELLVDEEEGAGLHLETVTEGLKICEIAEVPGQPGLRTDDIIVAVDGLPLWWSACEHDPKAKAPRQESGESEVKDAESDDDAPSARFRARFRRGARLDVFRQKAPEAAPAPMRQPILRAQVGSRRAARFCCPICWDSFDRWNDCLQHLRELGHEPEPPPDQRREEAAACLRRWMPAPELRIPTARFLSQETASHAVGVCSPLVRAKGCRSTPQPGYSRTLAVYDTGFKMVCQSNSVFVSCVWGGGGGGGKDFVSFR